MTKRKDYFREYHKEYSLNTKQVKLVFSKEQYKFISQLAKKERVKIAPFLKELALSQIDGQAFINSTAKEDLKALRFAIYNIANNINQIAHHSNQIQRLTEKDSGNLLIYLKQLNDTIESYTKGELMKEQGYDH